MIKLEKTLAQKLGSTQGMDEDDISVLEFGIATVKSTIISFSGVLLAGVLVGQLLGTLVISFTVALMRAFTGGPHCSTEYRCAITSGLVFGILGYLSPFIWPSLTLGLILLASLPLFLSILAWAPQDCPEKPIISPSYRRKLKGLGLTATAGILILQCFLIYYQNPAFAAWIAEGMVWQAVLLSPLGVWIIKRLDLGLEKLGRLIER